MGKFGTDDVVEKVFESKYIAPGIYQNIKIDSVEGADPEGKSPYVAFNFSNTKNQTISVRFYLSEGALQRSKEKIKHIQTKLLTEEQIKTCTGNTATEYGAKLNSMLAGKTIPEFKFIGEEQQGNTAEGKKNWFKATVGLPPFASTQTGKLKFDANNNYDMKRLTPPTNMDTMTTPKVSDGTGLPF